LSGDQSPGVPGLRDFIDTLPESPHRTRMAQAAVGALPPLKPLTIAGAEALAVN
jgi:hypothetical protein